VTGSVGAGDGAAAASAPDHGTTDRRLRLLDSPSASPAAVGGSAAADSESARAAAADAPLPPRRPARGRAAGAGATLGPSHAPHVMAAGSFSSVHESQTHHPGGAAATRATALALARVARPMGASAPAANRASGSVGM
jgi:hypothetical protein